MSECNYPTIPDDYSIGDILKAVHGSNYDVNCRLDTADYLDDLEYALSKTFVYWYANKVRCEQPSVIRHYLKTLNINHCELCGKERKLELHHIIPVCNGGGNERQNIIFVCNDCHKKFRCSGGREPGDILVTQKGLWIKREIKARHKDYGGDMNDKELMKDLGVARNTYYKYKRELNNEETKAGLSGFSF